MDKNQGSEKKTEKPKKKKKEQDSIFYRLYGRATLLLVFLQLILILLYVSGNFQGFMDSTLRDLLMLCNFMSIATVFFCAFGFFASIVMFFITKRKRNWFFLLCYLLGFVFATVFLLVFRLITFVSSGI